MMRIMGFGGFGKAKKAETKNVKILDTVKVVSAAPAQAAPTSKQEKQEEGEASLQKSNIQKEHEKDSSSDHDSDSDEEDLVDRLPFAASCSLKDHEKAITSISLDGAQSRFLTAGRDNMVKLWDFSTMRGNFKPFKSVQPVDSCPIRDVQWGIKGDCFLVVPSNWQPMLYDREGRMVCSFEKGDPYLRDLKNVKGHTSTLTCGRWHPNDFNIFLTASFDSTIKVWDINNRVQCKSSLFTPAKGQSDRYGITSAIYSHDGRRVVAGDTGGLIKVWTASGTQTRADITINNAHAAGNAITSVQLSLNNHNVISRAMDDTLKLWDTRNPSKVVAVKNGLDIFNEEANCIYSPNEKYVLTGTASRDKNPGYICVYESSSLEEIGKVEMTSSCVRLMWPARMDQLFCGLGDGSVKAFYDPNFSSGGVILPILNTNKKLAIEDYDKFVGSIDIGGEMDGERITQKDRKKMKKEWEKKREMTKPGLIGYI